MGGTPQLAESPRESGIVRCVVTCSVPIAAIARSSPLSALAVPGPTPLALPCDKFGMLAMCSPRFLALP